MFRWRTEEILVSVMTIRFRGLAIKFSNLKVDKKLTYLVMFMVHTDVLVRRCRGSDCLYIRRSKYARVQDLEIDEIVE